MSAAVPDRLLAELGRAEGGAEALRLLVDDQHTRRLILFRALLDAAGRAPEAVLPAPVADRLRRDWALLEAADHADREAARRVLFYPLVGPWLQRCLRGLATAVRGDAPADPADARPADADPTTAGAPVAPAGLHRDLSHLGALAAAAATRAGVPFSRRLPVHGGLLGLPTLGALRCHAPTAGLRHDAGVLTVAPAGDRRRPAAVRSRADGSWRSADPRWLPVHLLDSLPRPVLLDDLDPFRTVDSGLEQHGLGATGTLTGPEHAGWDAVWDGVYAMLWVAGEGRVAETRQLLHCLVPLARPPGGGPDSTAVAHCSGTRREAFGAVLSSTPGTSSSLAATLVHELQHAKLAALTDLLPLHHADGRARYWAPWRPDPRPFDGLLQGAYAHLALAGYWQRYALWSCDPADRDNAWAEHSRCRAQVGAALPALRGSRSLTAAGRTLVEGMAGQHVRLLEHPPPKGHLARAAAYVETARTMWRRQQTR